MATTVAYKVFGIPGHRQRASFHKSVSYDWSNAGSTRIVELLNSDKTGTNEYSVIRITRDTLAECEQELIGQLTDGIFENCRTGWVETMNSDTAYLFQ